jgi:hypothetical protein
MNGVNENDFKEYAMVKGELDASEIKLVESHYYDFFKITGSPINYNLLEEIKGAINKKIEGYKPQTAKKI